MSDVDGTGEAADGKPHVPHNMVSRMVFILSMMMDDMMHGDNMFECSHAVAGIRAMCAVDIVFFSFIARNDRLLHITSQQCTQSDICKQRSLLHLM